jgi:hypothetical protein
MPRHGKRNDSGGIEQAERILQEMINAGNDATKPDCTTFNTLFESYVRSKDKKKASERARELFECMEELKVEPMPYTFTTLQNIYSTSDLPDAPQKSLEVLQMMLSLYKNGSLRAKPSRSNYNAVLGALSRTYNNTSAKMAATIIKQMETPLSEGGFDVEPDRLSYALAILTCVRCPDDFGMEKAEEILLQMEARARQDEEKRRAVSSAAPASVVLDLEVRRLAVYPTLYPVASAFTNQHALGHILCSASTS